MIQISIPKVTSANALAHQKQLIFLVSACQTPVTVSPKKKKNNKGKAEDVVSSDRENSDPKQRLSFAEQESEQDGMLLQTNIEFLLAKCFPYNVCNFFGKFLNQDVCSEDCHNLLN